MFALDPGDSIRVRPRMYIHYPLPCTYLLDEFGQILRLAESDERAVHAATAWPVSIVDLAAIHTHETAGVMPLSGAS